MPAIVLLLVGLVLFYLGVSLLRQIPGRENLPARSQLQNTCP